MKTTTRARGILLLPLVLGACATATTDPASERYEGHYTWGFEANGFQPCGSDEVRWVVGGDLHTRYDAVATRDYEPVYAEVMGEVGPRGEFGHLGAHERELAVEEVLEIRPARDADCR